MADISAWSPVDESNNTAPPHGWPENMQPSAVNNSARALMGGVRRWYDSLTNGSYVLPYLSLSGGTLTGPLNITGALGVTGAISSTTTIAAPTIYANTALYAQGAGGITASSITASGNIGGNVITGNLLQSNGNIAAIGDISCNDFTGTGTVTGAALSSTGGITAAASVYAAFLSSSGALSIGTNFDVGGNGSIQGALGVVGNIVTNASLSVAGNITCGNVTAAGVVSAPYLVSNASHQAGTLLTWGGGNHVNFRWNGASLLFRIDETVEHAIAVTSLMTFEELADTVNALALRVEALEATPVSVNSINT